MSKVFHLNQRRADLREGAEKLLAMIDRGEVTTLLVVTERPDREYGTAFYTTEDSDMVSALGAVELLRQRVLYNITTHSE